MNRVKKAIIMAAGTGTRMQPLTLERPKPLIQVNGKPMIEGIIEELFRKGIKDIVVIIGYLGEQFEYLEKKFGVKLIYNNDYSIANNISSLYYARHELDSCVILDGDQIIGRENTIKKTFKHSGYTCWFSKEQSKEWMLTLNSDSKIENCARDGGKRKWELKGLSYWTRDDALKLSKLVEIEYERGNRQIYWDDIAMFIYKDEFDLYGHKVVKNSIIEIDNIEELIAIDRSYSYLRSAK